MLNVMFAFKFKNSAKIQDQHQGQVSKSNVCMKGKIYGIWLGFKEKSGIKSNCQTLQILV
jgi:hypothetical protein